MESENTLVFVVEKKATKNQIKAFIESQFKAKVRTVRTLTTRDGKKRAYVSFSMETPAIDVATTLGIV